MISLTDKPLDRNNRAELMIHQTKETDISIAETAAVAIPEQTDLNELTPSTVLVVEDNAEMQQYLPLALQPNGYTVLEAYDGISGIESAMEYLPDLIICDIMMPGKDGYDPDGRVSGAIGA